MKIGQKLTYAALVVLIISSLVMSQSMLIEAAEIAANAKEVQPAKAGELAPSFTVRTVDDEPFLFDPENLDAPAILITFRGGWCPYCNLHLSELRTVVPQLADKGIDVYFLSGDRPELLYASLKQETQEDIEGLGYTILSDANIEAALALGIAFKTDAGLMDYMQEKNRDIDGSSIQNFQVLPVPAVYMIDKSGMITYAFVEPDYKVRLPSDELLDAAEALND